MPPRFAPFPRRADLEVKGSPVQIPLDDRREFQREHRAMQRGVEEWASLNPHEVSELFRGTAATWWLSGGVALDLFLGFASRAHRDIDVSVPRSDWPLVGERMRERLELFIAAGGRLYPLPDGEVHADVHALWGRELSGGPWGVQINFEEVDGRIGCTDGTRECAGRCTRCAGSSRVSTVSTPLSSSCGRRSTSDPRISRISFRCCPVFRTANAAGSPGPSLLPIPAPRGCPSSTHSASRRR